MNSSGIKRGLAVSAVAAMAVTGVPFLASSASAATGDAIQVGSVGPVRNGGAEGGVVVLKTKGVVPANVRLIATTLQGAGGMTVTGPNQAVTLLPGATIATSGSANDSNKADGFDEITMRVTVTTPADGGEFSVVAYEEEGGTTGVDAAEPRATVSGTTAGEVAALSISPASQTAPANTPSGDYTLTLRDSGNRVTQLTGAETVALTATAGATVNESAGAVDATEAPLGTRDFTAQGSTPGAFIITADGPNSSQATATLQVVKAAGALTESEVDFVSDADGWQGFGGGVLANDGNTTVDEAIPVRVDQTAVRVDVRSTDPTDAGGVVALQLTGTGITFGGQATTVVSTTLDSNGRGSLTITPDAGSVQEGDSIAVAGNGIAATLNFTRGQLSAVNSQADTYVSQIDGTVDITVTATDQFGLPVAGAYVDAQRAGANSDATPTAKKVTDANGQATFTFTDDKATNNQTDTVTFRVFRDQFAANPIDPDGDSNYAEHFDTATIRYTTEGTGSDFVLNLDGINASGTSYDPAAVNVVPLTDTDAGAAGADAPAGDEVVNLDIVGGDTGAPTTVTVDNGALLLRAGETRLAEGSASESVVLPDAGPQALRIVGTKSGVVTVTVTSGGRTKTAQFTVSAQTNPNRARNVSLTSPEDADPGSIATVTARVTDAFGNPVANVPVTSLNVQVSGQGSLQDTGAVTDASGNINLNVRVQDDATGSVTVRVQGIGAEFGAAADQQVVGAPEGGAKGLPASENIAEASIAINTVEPPVEPKKGINLVLKGKNNGKKADRLTANANKHAAGLTAHLFKGRKQVQAKLLNAHGNVKFKVKDTNGKKKTKYTVKVLGTATTKADRATKRVR